MSQRGLNRSPSPAASASLRPCMSRYNRCKDWASRISGEQLVKNMSRPVRSFALRTQSSDPIAYQRLSRSCSHEADAEGGAHRRMASIAVLPFTNLSGDPEQEYFADGIAEDIITSLSKISNLLVISRNSTFAYKGKAVDAHVVGRELNVRYVLEGSVRKAGGRVRISAQLVEAIGRQQLWAVRFAASLATSSLYRTRSPRTWLLRSNSSLSRASRPASGTAAPRALRPGNA